MPRRTHKCENCRSTQPTQRLYIKVPRSWQGVGWWCRVCGHITIDEEFQKETGGKLEIVESDIRLDTPTGGLLRHIVTKGGLSRQHITTTLGQGRELEILKACELVEVFGNMVLPTVEARILVKTQ